jgi:hypothetical protein
VTPNPKRIDKLSTNQGIAEELYLTVVMIDNPKQGVQVIITEELPPIYLVRFKLVGSIMKTTGKFRVSLVYPMDGYPFLRPREEGQLVQVLNSAVAVQLPNIYVTEIHKPMLQSEEAQQLPRRRIQFGQVQHG